MLPLKDENPTRLTPFVTVAIIAANLYVWIWVQGAGAHRPLEASVASLGAYPCDLTGACAAEGLGWASLLTSMFVHGGWEHILGNMLFLWVFGNNIEDAMGHVRFALFYLLCGVAAALTHILLSPSSDTPMVGASGAISGIMGAYIVLYPSARVRTWIPPVFLVSLRAWLLLGYWFLLQLGAGLVSFGAEAADAGGVAVWAHVGGFAAGLLLIRGFESDRSRADRAYARSA